MTPISILALMATRLSELQMAVDESIRQEKSRDQQVSRLYEELDRYRRATQDERMLDLARGIFLVLDKLEPSEDGEIPIELVREELLDCLASVGVERISGVPGTLDAQSETVVGFLDDVTDDRADRKVISDGYRTTERVIRPRRILISRDAA